MERVTGEPGGHWCMSGVDIFADLSAAELETIGAATPHKNVPPGQLVYAPHSPVEALFILKSGRVRIFRVASDGRALTTALISPGTVFGEMGLVGQQMHDNFAEALEETVVCVLSRDHVQRFLLQDARVAARITEILGRRVAELERRLTDAAYKSVPARVASTLAHLASGQKQRRLGRGVQLNLTHEQVAALVGTSRETTTKVLGEFADRGLVGLGRGRITLLRPDELEAEAGD